MHGDSQDLEVKASKWHSRYDIGEVCARRIVDAKLGVESFYNCIQFPAVILQGGFATVKVS